MSEAKGKKWNGIRLIKYLVKILLYGNFWIALAALAMYFQTELLLIGRIEFNALACFTFSGTLFLYATHRLVALKRLEDGEAWQERFFYISNAYRSIYIYAFIALICTVVFYFQLNSSVQLALLIPGLIALAYVFPILKNNKRVRDIHFLKIFLIALIWAWVTVFIPALNQHMYRQVPMFLIFLERSLFIFAITLPFDIRDLLLDNAQNVKTLPNTFGAKATRKLAALVLLIMLTLVYFNYTLDTYTLSQVIALSSSALMAYGLVHFANPEKPDYYFTGFLDGTMVLQFVLVYLVSSF